MRVAHRPCRPRGRRPAATRVGQASAGCARQAGSEPARIPCLRGTAQFRRSAGRPPRYPRGPLPGPRCQPPAEPRTRPGPTYAVPVGCGGTPPNGRRPTPSAAARTAPRCPRCSNRQRGRSRRRPTCASSTPSCGVDRRANRLQRRRWWLPSADGYSAVPGGSATARARRSSACRPPTSSSAPVAAGRAFGCTHRQHCRSGPPPVRP